MKSEKRGTAEKELWEGIAQLKWEVEHELYMEREHQIAVMMAPKHWIHANALPLTRRRQEGKELGFIYNDTVEATLPLMPTVYLGCMWDIPATKKSYRLIALSREQVMHMACIKYPTFAAIANDGWEIDN